MKIKTVLEVKLLPERLRVSVEVEKTIFNLFGKLLTCLRLRVAFTTTCNQAGFEPSCVLIIFKTCNQR